MISGLSIKGYRSFGKDGIELTDLAKVNVLIGKNNSGKSNVLRFVKLLSDVAKKRVKPDGLLDYSREDRSHSIEFGLQIDDLSSFNRSSLPSQAEEVLKKLSALLQSEGRRWLYFDLDNGIKPSQGSVASVSRLFRDKIHKEVMRNLTDHLLGHTSNDWERNSGEVAQKLHVLAEPCLDVHLIDAFRRISDTGDNSLAGDGLIESLRKLKSPVLGNYEDKKRFEKIVHFLRELLGEPSADVEIPAETKDIYVAIKDKVLPLASLGTGIHELIILASAVTLYDDAVFCIEEPEIHLHPELQKKFIRYILHNTNNQYFIASHSNAFFDQQDVNIYRCQIDAGQTTKCDLVSTSCQKHEVLLDLGYRPSDLLLANYVIWVEGPSDRIYVNHWIQDKAPDLVEGLHYAIMFYGGRLLAHLAYDDPLVKEFVQLSSLNRNACIVMDSDRETARSHLGETKRRVIDDFRSKGCYVWVTKGRTIENYIPEPLFNEAIAFVHPRTKRHIQWEQFKDMTHLREDKVMDKVAVARTVSVRPSDYLVLDLGKQIEGIVKKIYEHNEHVRTGGVS